MKSPLHPARAFVSRAGRLHIIIPVSVLNSAAHTIIALGLVFYLRDRFGAGAQVIGLASALFNGLYFVACFALRPVNLRIRPRFSLVISSFSAAGLLALLSTATQVWAVLALYSAVGFALALFWPPIMGWLSAGVEGQLLNRQISYFNLSWSAGVIIGPLVAGLLAERDVALPLFAGVAITTLVGIAVLAASFFLPGIRADEHRDRRGGPGDEPDTSTPLRFPSWIGLVPSYAVLGALLVVVPLHARDQLGLVESSIGLVLLLRGLAASIGFWLFGRWSGWHFRALPTVAAPVVLAALLLALSTGGSLVSYVVVIPLIGFAISATYTFSVFHGVAGTADRTRRMAIHEALLTVGSVFGALGAGRLYETGGARAAYIGCVAALVLGVLAQFAFLLARRIYGPRNRRAPDGR